MERIFNHDSYLDPHDSTPEYSTCDGCGQTFRTQDLHKTGKHYPHAWLCDDCISTGEPREGENGSIH